MDRAKFIAGSFVVVSLLLSSCSAQTETTPEPGRVEVLGETPEVTEFSEDIQPQKMVHFDLAENSGCGVMDLGTLWCWGLLLKNDNGDAPFTDDQGRAALRQVRGIEQAVAVVVTSGRVCVLHKDESISCFAEAPNFVAKTEVVSQTGLQGLYTLNRQLGGPEGVDDFSDVPGLEDAVVISGERGRNHGCAALSDGSVRCWGEGAHGQLGIGRSVSESLTAVRVPGLEDSVSARVEGDASCALGRDGMISCWGHYNGSLPVLSGAPYVIPSLSYLGIQQVGLGGEIACVLDKKSEVWCWGGTIFYMILDSSRSREDLQRSIDSPWKVPGVANVVDLVVGDKQACALISNGTVKCWGTGILGDGRPDFDDEARGPITVPGVNSAVNLSGDGYGWCAVLADGTAQCWGRLGSLGILTKVSGSASSGVSEHLLPTVIDVGVPLSQITPTAWALTQSGALLRINDGQGDEYQSGSTPRASKFWEIPESMCVQAINGSEVFCRNAAGLRGDGGPDAFFGPFEEVGELNGVIEIASRDYSQQGFSCAVLSDSSAWCWGRDSIATSQPLENLLHPVSSPGAPVFYSANRVQIPPARDVDLGLLGGPADRGFMPGGGCAVSTDFELWCWGIVTATYQWFSPIKFQTSWGHDEAGEE